MKKYMVLDKTKRLFELCETLEEAKKILRNWFLRAYKQNEKIVNFLNSLRTPDANNELELNMYFKGLESMIYEKFGERKFSGEICLPPTSKRILN